MRRSAFLIDENPDPLEWNFRAYVIWEPIVIAQDRIDDILGIPDPDPELTRCQGLPGWLRHAAPRHQQSLIRLMAREDALELIDHSNTYRRRFTLHLDNEAGSIQPEGASSGKNIDAAVGARR